MKKRFEEWGARGGKILTREVLWSDTAILVYLARVKLLIHLLNRRNE